MARPAVTKLPEDLATLSPDETRQLIHDLHVHQIELEMQNDELRRTRADLDAAQARYFDFYDLAPVGYITVDAQGLILHANLNSATQLGLMRSALLQQVFNKFIHKEDQDRFYLLQQRVMATQAAQSDEFRVVNGNAQLWVQMDAVAATGDGGAPEVRLVLIDISERKRFEDRLIRDEAKLKTILDGASDAIFINDGQGRFQYVNQQAVDMLGYGRDELLRMGVADVTPEQDAPLTQRMLAQLMATGSLRYEPTLRRRDGSTLTTELSARRLADGSGFAACRDITERKQLQAAQIALAVEAEIAISRQHLREMAALNEATLEEERKHIAREVHDELGQVLTALRMDMSLLSMRYGTLDPALHGEVQGMKKLVDRAIQGVRNVATHLRPVALDMGLVPAVEWLCQEFSRTNALPCKLDAQGELELDELRAVVIFRILQESLTNITRYAKASAVAVTLSRQGHNLRLEVCDDGCGFDARAIGGKHSFGLLGMRERAIALGGCLDIASAPERGTRVALTIPFNVDAAGGLP